MRGKDSLKTTDETIGKGGSGRKFTKRSILHHFMVEILSVLEYNDSRMKKARSRSAVTC